MCASRGEHTLTEQHMSDSSVDIVVERLTAVDHQTIGELHALGTLTTELARHHHLTALGTTLHDEAQHTIAGSAYRNIQSQ